MLACLHVYHVNQVKRAGVSTSGTRETVLRSQAVRNSARRPGRGQPRVRKG